MFSEQLPRTELNYKKLCVDNPTSSKLEGKKEKMGLKMGEKEQKMESSDWNTELEQHPAG